MDYQDVKKALTIKRFHKVTVISNAIDIGYAKAHIFVNQSALVITDDRTTVNIRLGDIESIDTEDGDFTYIVMKGIIRQDN